MKTLSVRFYKSLTGNESVRDWLKALSKENKIILGEDIKTVEFGWPLGMPLVRKLVKGLWEIRSHLANREIARIFFTVQNDIMVLLHAFKKKTQKTPDKELNIARERRNKVLK